MNPAPVNAIPGCDGERGAAATAPQASSPARIGAAASTRAEPSTRAAPSTRGEPSTRAAASTRAEPVLAGSEAQVEWANRIRAQVNTDFDRVAASFRVVAARQIRGKRAETESILAILEEKRAEVMAATSAGYFIHDWQETGDRVRKLIVRDPRYQAIQSSRAARLASARAPVTTRGHAHPRLRPLAGNLAVERAAAAETSDGGVLIPGSARAKPQQGKVIAAGRGVLLTNGQTIPLNVQVGDSILFGKDAGVELAWAGATFLILREQDILAVLDPPIAGTK